MGARQGPENPLSGPRLSRTLRPDTGHEELGDPANGETVPRCRTCGNPGSQGNALLDFDLLLHGKPAGRYRLCERDWLWANPPGPVDPLDASDAA
jgi:hypothetical protein